MSTGSTESAPKPPGADRLVLVPFLHKGSSQEELYRFMGSAGGYHVHLTTASIDWAKLRLRRFFIDAIRPAGASKGIGLLNLGVDGDSDVRSELLPPDVDPRWPGGCRDSRPYSRDCDVLVTLLDQPVFEAGQTLSVDLLLFGIETFFLRACAACEVLEDYPFGPGAPVR